ncbi:HAMP domain-containing protein [Patescibacteria group bacterium]|nr:HAMP domain-containing protein [Patescibacteria group bacterium]
MKKKTNIRTQGAKKPRSVSIQLKLFGLLGFFAVVLFATAAYGLYSVSLISNASESIIEREIPLTRGIEAALVAMLEGNFALEVALAVDDFSQVGEVLRHEADLNSSTLVFDAYLAAITWGSTSEAFIKSDGGLNFAEWQRLGLSESLVIPRPPSQQVQLAGITDLYFGGFQNNAVKAISSHKKFLRLASEGKEEEANQAEELSQEYAARASAFSGLTISKLSEITKISDDTISQSANIIRSTKEEVGRNILLIFLVGSTISLVAGLFFVRRSIVQPLRRVTYVAERISAGDFSLRADIKSNDEIGILAAVFNQMADTLSVAPIELEAEVGRRTKQLTQINIRLQELLNESYASGKMFVQKDRELTSTNREMVELNRELGEIGKMLVRRDLELTATNERLEELDAVKSEFVSVAAHQLRTPLTGIKWTLHSLSEEEFGKINPEQKRLVRDGLISTLRLIDLVNDLLDTARLEEGRLGFAFKIQSFIPQLEYVLQRYKKAAAEKGITLSLNLPKAKLPSLYYDEERIGLVLDNLLDNAIKYTTPGGKVTINCKKTKTHVIVEVKDTGIGIPEEQFHRVFTKFFRAKNAQLAQTDGTGLGLYVSKNIIANHKGALFFKSKENRGSTFSFSLPIPSSKDKVT